MHSSKLLSSETIIELSKLWLLRPHSPCTLSKLEASLSFSESVDVATWHFHVDLNEFVLENKSLVGRIYQFFTGPCAGKWKTERVSLELEVNKIKSVLVLWFLLVD